MFSKNHGKTEIKNYINIYDIYIIINTIFAIYIYTLFRSAVCVKDGSGNPFCPDFYRAKRLERTA